MQSKKSFSEKIKKWAGLDLEEEKGEGGQKEKPLISEIKVKEGGKKKFLKKEEVATGEKEYKLIPPKEFSKEWFKQGLVELFMIPARWIALIIVIIVILYLVYAIFTLISYLFSH